MTPIFSIRFSSNSMDCSEVIGTWHGVDRAYSVALSRSLIWKYIKFVSCPQLWKPCNRGQVMWVITVVMCNTDNNPSFSTWTWTSKQGFMKPLDFVHLFFHCCLTSFETCKELAHSRKFVVVWCVHSGAQSWLVDLSLGLLWNHSDCGSCVNVELGQSYIITAHGLLFGEVSRNVVVESEGQSWVSTPLTPADRHTDWSYPFPSLQSKGCYLGFYPTHNCNTHRLVVPFLFTVSASSFPDWAVLLVMSRMSATSGAGWPSIECGAGVASICSCWAWTSSLLFNSCYMVRLISTLQQWLFIA